MTLKEMCRELGIPLWLYVYYHKDYPGPQMGTHTCRLDPTRCSVVIDGVNNPAGVPHGLGFNEQESMADLARNLLLCKNPDSGPKPKTAVIRYKSVYDNGVREFPIPADLTA